jgi:hypothetical protein
MSELAKGLLEVFTERELRALLAETGSMTTPEIQKLAGAINEACQTFVDARIQAVLES